MSGGSELLMMSHSRSSTAVAASSTRATLELVKRHGLPAARLLKPEPGALVRARDRVEDLGDAARVGVRLVERGREERSRERPFLDVHALGEARQLRGSLGAPELGDGRERLVPRARPATAPGGRGYAAGSELAGGDASRNAVIIGSSQSTRSRTPNPGGA